MISFIYSVVYVFLNTVCINVEFFVLTADGLRRFFQIQFDDCCCEEHISKGQSRRELAEEKKVRSRDVAQREDSEGLRSTGSQKTNRLLSRIVSSRGPGLEKVHQLLSWSLFTKCS